MSTLYNTSSSGKTRYWSVEVVEEDDRVFIVRRYGIIDGKETVNKLEVKSGKNIGKKNETSKLQQAKLEAKSLWNKQCDSGYYCENDKPFKILPMLANKWSERNKYINEPFFVQPKLDGVRLLLGKYEGNIIALSRTGKEMVNFEFLKSFFRKRFNEGDFFDGEMYSPDKSFEDITSEFKTNPVELKFYIFDYFNIHDLNKSFVERNDYINTFFKMNKINNIEKVKTILVNKKSDIKTYHDEFVSQKYEGTMIRDMNSKYILGERSNFLLKHKDFNTDEYIITDVAEGTGKDKGTAVWLCSTKDGCEFSVRHKGSYEKRREYLINKEKYIGKMLTVQYQNLTKYNVPRFPVGIALRDYE